VVPEDAVDLLERGGDVFPALAIAGLETLVGVQVVEREATGFRERWRGRGESDGEAGAPSTPRREGEEAPAVQGATPRSVSQLIMSSPYVR
jgi:hypothetical protein